MTTQPCDLIRAASPAPPPATSGIAFRDVPPPTGFSQWVASCWSLTIPESTNAMHYTRIPDGCAHLVARAGHAWIIGPRVGPERIAAVRGSVTFGLRLHPGAVRALLPLRRVASLQGASLEAATLPGLSILADWASALDASRPLAELVVLTESLLTDLAGGASPLDPVATTVVSALQCRSPAPTTAALSAESGLSGRQLRRRFAAAVDLTLRDYRRLSRFRRCVLELASHAADEASWARRALQWGFADQSHMVREFRRLAGLAPREFIRRLRNVEHTGLWDPSSRRSEGAAVAGARRR